MHHDPIVNPHPHLGSIEVITGSMFSGKTEELIRRLRRALLAQQRVQVFRSAVDTRSDDHHIVSHDQNTMQAMVIDDPKEMLDQLEDVDVVGIDEAQFFARELAEVCNQMANKGIRVIVAGLDMDYKGEPFGAVPNLMAMAERVTKVQAVCVHCGNPAHYSVRTTSEKNQVVIGASDHYVPLCRKCSTHQ